MPLGQGLKLRPSGGTKFRPKDTRTKEKKVDRAQKAEQISQLNEAFGKAGVVVVARYQGMTVADMSKLRSQMRAVGASFKVSKNRLAKRATEGTSVKPINDLSRVRPVLRSRTIRSPRQRLPSNMPRPTRSS